MKSLDRQSRHHPEQYDDSNDSDEISFFDYIMSVKLPKGFKPSINMEPYDGNTNLQEHLDTFKSKMVFTSKGVHGPVCLVLGKILTKPNQSVSSQ